MQERTSSYFLAIAQELNISRAADKLFISQPSLSKFLAQLENKLAVKLFLRNREKLELTAAGEVFLQYIHADNELKNEYTNKLAAVAQENVKKLIIGCGSTTSRYLAQIVFPKFKKIHPNIDLVIKEELHVSLLSLLKQKKVDLAMLVASKADSLPDGFFEEIMVQPRLLVTSKDHPLANKVKNSKRNDMFHPQQIKPKDLQGYTLITGIKGQQIYYDLLEFKKKQKLTEIKFVSSQNVDASLALAACNMGIYVVPAFNLLNRSEFGKFYYFTVNDDLMYWRQIIRYPSENPPAVVREFTAIAKQELVRFNDC